ncbi:MAG: Gldg family protein, partial [Luteibaculum sp.]
DASCAPIPINVGKFGDKPNLQLFPWFFHPTLISTSKHPVVSNLSPILSQFISSVDTVGNPQIRKEILLHTSPLTLRRMAPARVSLNIVSMDPGFNERSIGEVPVGVLLEGKFNSLYANRISPIIANDSTINFKPKALVDSRIVVIGDGEIAKNYSSADGDRVFPLGYDKYLRQNLYGNKDLITNAVDFLLNDEKLIKIRAKDIVIRKLNERKVLEQEGTIQVANMLLPVLLVAALVVVMLLLKKRFFK